MTLRELEGQLCAPHQAVIVVRGMYAKCAQGCTTADLSAYAKNLNGHASGIQDAGSTPEPPSSTLGARTKANGPTGGNPVEPSHTAGDTNDLSRAQSNGHYGGGQELSSAEEGVAGAGFLLTAQQKADMAQRDELGHWRSRIKMLAISLFRADPEYQKGHLTWELVAEDAARDLGIALTKFPEYAKPSFLSASEAEEEAERYFHLAWDEFRTKERNDLVVANGYAPSTTEPPKPIVWETFDAALIANDAYLLRTPVIDKLCYSSAVSMITGGKHAGKSTLARWMAVCVAKGWQFLDRPVTQGPVFYIASEDETMAARQELIRLGWTQDDSLRFLSAQNIATEEPEEFLWQLVEEIRKFGAALVILDMLFDFVRIADEMSYAGTREALGKIQKVASASGSHIVAIHHAPKNAAIGDAAVAALGSQGLAARVSPIILVRRFGPGVHSVSSTSVRDPRGEPILDSRLVKNEDGSVVLGGAFKNYMLAEVYTERVIEILEAEDGGEYTAGDVATALEISYQVASKCLSLLNKLGRVCRTGAGKKGKPFRYAILASAPNTAETGKTDSYSWHVSGDAINTNSEKAQGSLLQPNSKGQYGYKED